MTLEEIRQALDAYNLKKVATATGLLHTVVWRFKTGKTVRPSWQLVDTLERFLTEGRTND